jgi:hypothetical protein
MPCSQLRTKSRPRLALQTLSLTIIAVGASSAPAETDLSGTWSIVNHEEWLERGRGPSIGEYQGLPLNEPARLRAMTWSSATIDMPERQCASLPLDYALTWSPVRIWTEVDSVTQQVIAIRMHREFQEIERTIYMDNRPHPPKNAPHTWQGFSTGKWDGEKLIVTSTHLKEGYIRRNGVPRSDQATVIESYMRHGDHLTIGVVVNDPVYMTEPLIRTMDYTLDLTRHLDAFTCEVVTELSSVQAGDVPHYFPWKNPFVREYSKKTGIPFDTTQGAAIQMYPSFLEEGAR